MNILPTSPIRSDSPPPMDLRDILPETLFSRAIAAGPLLAGELANSSDSLPAPNEQPSPGLEMSGLMRQTAGGDAPRERRGGVTHLDVNPAQAQALEGTRFNESPTEFLRRGAVTGLGVSDWQLKELHNTNIVGETAVSLGKFMVDQLRQTKPAE